MPTQQLTVVVVNDFGHVNAGTAQVAIVSACELAKRGYRVIFFCSVGPIDESLSRAGVRVICTEQHEILANPQRTAAAIQGLWNRKTASAMDSLLASLHSEKTVVHLHGWTKALSASVLRVILSRRFRIVSTIHEYFLACPNGGFFNYVSQTICRLQPMSAACLTSNCDSRSYPNKLWRIARQQIQTRFAGIPHGIKDFITLSDLSQEVIGPFLPEDANIYPIGNPIDVVRREPARPAENRVFVSVGRLSPEKGGLLLAEAARRTGLPVKFVGDGYLKDKLQQEYPECEVTGWLPREQVEKEVENARALIFPSLWYENQPLVILEAAARGVPCVVPDTSAARESVVDGRTGLWFRGADCDDLCAKLLLLNDPALVSSLGHAAYKKYWSAPPTLQTHVDQLETCYAEMMERSAEPSTTDDAVLAWQ